jgi:hypothetical protein
MGIVFSTSGCSLFQINLMDYENWENGFASSDGNLQRNWSVDEHGTQLNEQGTFIDLSPPFYYTIHGIPKDKFVVCCRGGIGGCVNDIIRHKECHDVPLFDYPLQNARIEHGGKTLQLDEVQFAELIAYIKESIAQKDYCPCYSWLKKGTYYELLDFIVDFQNSNELYYHGAIFFLEAENVAYFSFYLYDEEKDDYNDIHIPLSEEWVQKLQATFETK